MTARSDIEAARIFDAHKHVVTTAPYDGGVSAEKAGVTEEDREEDRRHRKNAAKIRKANSVGNMWGLKAPFRDPCDRHKTIRLKASNEAIPGTALEFRVRSFRHLNLLAWRKEPRTDKPSSPDYPEHPLGQAAPLYGGENRRHKENITYRLKLHRKKTPEERMKIREEALSDRSTRPRACTSFVRWTRSKVGRAWRSVGP